MKISLSNIPGYENYIEQHNKSYRDVDFLIVQNIYFAWIIIINNEKLLHQLDTYSDAHAYAMGYIDACIERPTIKRNDEYLD